MKSKKTRDFKYKNKVSTLNSESNQKKRKEKGVTLIALIVTIIILFILAGITISSLTGDNRSCNRSKKCKRCCGIYSIKGKN